MIQLLLAAILAVSAPDTVDTWRCSNAGLVEIQCAQDSCVVATPGNFTPVQASLTSVALEVCAYSGCLSGPASVMLGGERYGRWTARIENQPATLVIEESSGVGLLRWRSFVSPVLCQSGGQVGP